MPNLRKDHEGFDTADATELAWHAVAFLVGLHQKAPEITAHNACMHPAVSGTCTFPVAELNASPVVVLMRAAPSFPEKLPPVTARLTMAGVLGSAPMEGALRWCTTTAPRVRPVTVGYVVAFISPAALMVG